MSWSLQVMNGLETVFRTFDFARHIHDELIRASEGRGLKHFEYSTTWNCGTAALPRWWLIGVTRADDEIVGNGRGKVADWMAENGNVEPSVPMGLIYLCFWSNRATDLSPLLPPQIAVGSGLVTFKTWGKAHAFHDSYLRELGEAVNDQRHQGALLGLGTNPTKHLHLADDFEWRPLVTLESLDDGQKIKDLANELAAFVAGKVE
ncbi:MAG: hypothetical protein H6733_14435 [Alphaproteobacteria bacterium]|nr:hypothetical protein [Alphaproteobacteria bacterium]